jgi:hypothetical protein
LRGAHPEIVAAGPAPEVSGAGAGPGDGSPGGEGDGPKKDQHAAYNSAKGIVKNFVWKLTGLKPNGQPREYGSHWGVGVLLFDAGPQ